MSSFVTPKGTSLPMSAVGGKPYLLVAHRLVWFREEHPDWTIKTSVTADTEKKQCLAQAWIHDAKDRLIASAHKFENAQGFDDYIEKSETGAVGRALAMCGYGTQFAPDLDEGERIVDSPVARAKRSPEYDQFVEWATERGLEPPYVKGFVKELFGKESVSELSNVETFDLMRAISEARGEFDAEDRSLGIPLPQNKRLHPQGGITS